MRPARAHFTSAASHSSEVVKSRGQVRGLPILAFLPGTFYSAEAIAIRTRIASCIYSSDKRPGHVARHVNSTGLVTDWGTVFRHKLCFETAYRPRQQYD